jgi:hypothetical protein
MNILLFWHQTYAFLTKWLNNAHVSLHFSLQCGRPPSCMWYQEYLRLPNHGRLTLIEIHVGNGKIHV